MRFLLIDNYDSFVHNLARYCVLAGAVCDILRNDSDELQNINLKKYDGIVISPGPGTPDQAGYCFDVVKKSGQDLPLLGVCLGHQILAEAYGGETLQSGAPVHGRESVTTHNGSGVFANMPSPLKVGRYHSLVTDLPSNTPLVVTARTEDGIVMAVEHKDAPLFGVQFHPESLLTEHGLQIIKNFVRIAREQNLA